MFALGCQKQVAELEIVAEECEELKTKVKGLEDSKGWLERRLNEAEVCFA